MAKRADTSSPLATRTSLSTSRLLPVLLVLFAGSGAAALIYEIVWYQLLQLAIGSTAISLGVLLATFMGGLSIGSLALPRLFPAEGASSRHPLSVYAAIEFLIAIFGLIELLLIPLIGGAYLTGPQAGFIGMLLRGLVAAVCLLPPTILMGASLPAIVRWIESSPRGISWWGLLYGANTLGAVVGSLVAGFYLLRLYDVNIATFAAAACNISIAAVSLLLSLRSPARFAAEPEREKIATPQSQAAVWPVYVAIAFSGAAAIGSEVVWTRLLGLTLGATVYAFSIILAVFLTGLALGTAVGSALSRTLDPRASLAWCQLLAALGIAWTAAMIADWLPYWPINPQLSIAPIFTFQLDLVRSTFALLPATLCWGASFPFAFAAAKSSRDPGKTVGGVYAANTLGAIVGALAVSLVLIPWIGTRDTERALLAVSALSGLVLLFPIMQVKRSPALELATGVTIGLLGLFAYGMHEVPGELIAYGRRIATVSGQLKILMTAEGRNTSIAVSQWNDGAIQFHVAGKVEASTEGYDMKLQRMLGHLPGLMNPNPQSVLVVGFGAGVTAGTFTTYPSVKRIVVCELEPLIPPTSTKYFAKQNYNVMTDKRTEIVYDDARHFVASTPEKFDIITSDPIHPFVKGSATLYSKEYFEIVKAHLNKGGIVSQWVPLYESDVPTVQSEIATFFQVFPYGTVWANNLEGGGGYDLVLIGSVDPVTINLDTLETRYERADHARVRESLTDAKFSSLNELFATYAGSRAGLEPWLKNAEINHDRDLRLQYLAGLALNHSEENTILRGIMQFWMPPVDLFMGAPEKLDALFTTMVSQSQNTSGATKPDAPAPTK
ncbi:MAG TPA: fused MFS/spermidine synthase [Micropepsaceae bacterium]|nr:fused MFS/spermidine synthase [Micropepsaceae bacterium]